MLSEVEGQQGGQWRGSVDRKVEDKVEEASGSSLNSSSVVSWRERTSQQSGQRRSSWNQY